MGIIYKGVNRLGDGYITEVLTNVDSDEIVEMGGKIYKIPKKVFYKDNLKVSSLKKIMEYLFELKLEYEKEGNDLMVNLINLCMN